MYDSTYDQTFTENLLASISKKTVKKRGTNSRNDGNRKVVQRTRPAARDNHQDAKITSYNRRFALLKQGDLDTMLTLLFQGKLGRNRKSPEGF